MKLIDDIESALSEPDGIAEALRLVIDHFRAESGTIHLLESDGVLHLKAARGIPEPVLDLVRTVPIGKGMAGLAVQRKRPVDACNIQTDVTGDVRPGAKTTGMQGAIVVPIFAGKEAVGALGIANQSERTFGPEEKSLLMEVGRRIARCFHHVTQS